MSKFSDDNPIGAVADLLVINNSTPGFYDRLRSAFDGLSVLRNVTASAPALAYVKGLFVVGPNSSLDAPALIIIEGGLLVGPGATLRAPMLSRVTGKIEIEHGATLHAPLLPEATAKKIENRGRYSR